MERKWSRLSKCVIGRGIERFHLKMPKYSTTTSPMTTRPRRVRGMVKL